MNIEASSPEEYFAKLPEERKEAITKLREVITQNLPDEFKEEMSYGMIGYVELNPPQADSLPKNNNNRKNF